MTNVLGKVLQDDKNFHVEIVDWQGKAAVKKTAKPSMPPERLKRVQIDVEGMEFFRELASKNSKLDLYVPKIYDHGDNYYIREYINDDVVADQSRPFATAAPRVEQLAKLLAESDRLEPQGPDGYIGSSNYQNLIASIERWVKDNLAESLIDQSQAAQALKNSAGLAKWLQPRIAHGDMSAYKHAYIHEGKIALIDFEVFTTKAARYFDVAWCYTRMYGLGSPELAKHFLATFLSHAEKIEHQTEQLMAVFIQRAVGLQKDAQGDAKKGNDYRWRAQELLELVLQNDLSLLTSEKPTIKAIIFDCYGVLATEGFDLFRDKYYDRDQHKLRAANKAMDDFNAAQIKYDDFLKVVADLAGISTAEAEAFLADNKPNQPLFNYIHSELEGKYKIGLLSNVGGDWIKDLFGPEDTKLFDAIVLSYQAGLIKPDPQIYQLTAKKLDVEPGDCVYVDDREKHCEGARQAGMRALLYKNLDQLKVELEKLLAGSNN